MCWNHHVQRAPQCRAASREQEGGLPLIRASRFFALDGAPILCIEMAQNKAYTALFGVSTQDFFNFIQGDPSLLAGIPTLARVAAWGGGFPIKVNGEVVGAIGLSGAPTVQNDVDCARAALALVSDAVPGGRR